MRIKLLFACLMVSLPASVLAQTYQIDWWVIGSGGGTSQSANYQLSGTVGQPIVGRSSSANYSIEAGFWVGAAAGPSGCEYVKGDINNSGVANGIDVVYGVVYFKGGPPPPVRCDMCPQPAPFYAAGDVNASCTFNGIDIGYFVNFLKGVYPTLQFCATCPPAGRAVPPVPAIMPTSVPMRKGAGKFDLRD